MDRATRKLFFDHLNDIATLSKAQRDQIQAAIEAYDFTGDTTGLAWQKSIVASFKSGDYHPMELGSLVGGFVVIKACP